MIEMINENSEQGINRIYESIVNKLFILLTVLFFV